MGSVVIIVTSVLLALGAVYLVLRPVLKATDRFKAFYARADSFWGKVAAFGYNSATVALAYLQAAVGFVLTQIDLIAPVVGDPRLKDQISETLGANPVVLGYVLTVIAVITFVARMRSIARE